MRLRLISKLGVTNISSYEVPGSFEIPYATKKVIKNYDGAIVIGCLVKGETNHYEYISQGVTLAIQNVISETEKPIIFGVLTVQNIDQAKKRIKSATTYAENAVEIICNF